MPIIADHLTFVYGAKTPLQTTAVDDISVKIEDGQFTLASVKKIQKKMSTGW